MKSTISRGKNYLLSLVFRYERCKIGSWELGSARFIFLRFFLHTYICINSMNGILKYDPDIYTPSGLRKNISYKEARAEYARLRSITLRRLKRFEGTQYEATDIYRMYGDNYFPPLSDIKTPAALYFELSEIARLAQRRGATITGQRDIERKTLQTLQSRGYTGINSGNIFKFGEFMKQARANSTAAYFDSVRAAEIFGEESSQDLDVIFEEFQAWEEEHYGL